MHGTRRPPLLCDHRAEAASQLTQYHHSDGHSQEPKHVPVLLPPCAPRLHRAGPCCSPQNQGRTPPSRPPCWQPPCSRQAVAKDTSVLQAGALGLGMAPGCKVEQGHPFPSDRVHRPTMQPSLTRAPPKTSYIPWECPRCSCLPCSGRQHCPRPEGSTGLHTQQGHCFTRRLPRALGGSSV